MPCFLQFLSSGRPNMAQAGGKNPAGIDELIAKVPDTILAQIG